MRRSLALVSLAVTSMVALAFLVPLMLVVYDLARDRALTEAERQASALTPVLAITADPLTIATALASTEFGLAQRIAVHPAEGGQIGTSRASREQLTEAMRRGHASTVDVMDGKVVLQPVALGERRTALVESFVPQEELERGVTEAWVSLTAVALALVLLSVLIADRLGTRVVRSARTLAEGAKAIGAGDLGTRVQVSSPPELERTAAAFNGMAERIGGLVTAERELVADLSHRLRTPLTALRLDAETLGEGPGAQRIRSAVHALEREVDEIIRRARRGLVDGDATGCDAALVGRERLAFWAALAEDQHRPWRQVGADHPAPVRIARDELAAVLDALLGNVFRHTEEGVGFALGVRNRAGVVTILVDDSGPGIADPEEALSRGTSGAGSTGLGLDIAHRVVRAAGGSLRISSGPMSGTRIRLDLPAADASTGVSRSSRAADPADDHR
ncbi:HAMP domain-containing histidine kinase [Allokutzneria sp. A3M-2-11 16]|uniref:sensor histidine kinase n=1 Tax=Allokutzneria sp. A3M-2-11 16 TaxID=2962043 RepID=UPI0020B690F7|nr:HAMP domain-containing sensor histidine kinase [Allokutzneria sp. A3M-2-11 16]MCP3801400.1 HAMP domain-containing histidine kinase [Allokutzneria sp. A3M-2-11 16]